MEKERKVKGSAIVDLVNVVWMFKDLPWDQHLTPEDMEIINSMVMPNEWYPVEFTQRVTMAMFKLIAKGDLEMVKQFSRTSTKEMLKGPYRPFLDQGDPFQAIEKFVELRDSLYNFSRTIVAKLGEKSMTVRIEDLGEFNEDIDLFVVYQGIQLEEIIALNGGRDVSMDSAKAIHDQGALEFSFSWS